MKISQRILNKRINRVKSAISSSSTLPILSHIKFTLENDVLELVATDMEKFIIERIKVNAPSKPFACCVPGKLLSDMIGALSGEIELTFKQNKLHVKQGKKEVKINALEVLEFPVYPELPDTQPVILKTDELLYLITNTSFSAATDEGRPTLCGVNFNFKDKMFAVAADGFRLSYCEHDANVDLPNVIIPSGSVNDARSIFGDDDNQGKDIEIYSTDNQIIFDLPDTRLVTQLIPGQFPNAKQIIPTTSNVTVQLNRDTLLEAIKLFLKIAQGKEKCIMMEYQDDGIYLYADGGESGNAETEIKAKVDGDKYKTAFNGILMSDALSVMNGDIVLSQVNKNTPIAIRPINSDKIVHVVMPMEVREKQKEKTS